MKNLFISIIILFFTLLLGTPLFIILLASKVQTWIIIWAWLSFSVIAMIVSVATQKWVMKVFNIKQHEL